MRDRKQVWMTFALANLVIVALAGVTLRSKILFAMQGIDFGNLLLAHFNFAFTGWIALALLGLMVYDILPEALRGKKIYTWLLTGILCCAYGMLITFLLQGYAFFSILFSVVFVGITYLFCFFFLRDLLRSKAEKAVTILTVAALLSLVFSSVGPLLFTWMRAFSLGDHLLYRDAMYTYLHFQYNGFFTLGVFALFFNNLYRHLDPPQLLKVRRFAWAISISILPTLFISYLWHFQVVSVVVGAGIGCFSIAIVLFNFVAVLQAIKSSAKNIPILIKFLGLASFIAFVLKSLLQCGTIIPFIGRLVFGNRAIIIGYLHLILLGFISIYLIANFLHSGILSVRNRLTRIAIIIFVSGVIMNEIILMVQGLGNMIMLTTSIYAQLLLGVSVWIFSGALLLFIDRLRHTRSTSD